MSDKIDRSGPAFPTQQGQTLDGTWNQTYDAGMSYRQWLIGQALPGVTRLYPRGSATAAQLARDAIEIADAVIAAELGSRK